MAGQNEQSGLAGKGPDLSIFGCRALQQAQAGSAGCNDTPAGVTCRRDMLGGLGRQHVRFGAHLVVARVGGLLGKMATRRWRRRCRQTRPTTPPTFVEELRTLNVRPHVAQNPNRRRSAIDKRTTRHPGYMMSQRRHAD